MVLENKLGILNSSELAREEERISKLKAIGLFENRMLDHEKAGTFSTLKKLSLIHI